MQLLRKQQARNVDDNVYVVKLVLPVSPYEKMTQHPQNAPTYRPRVLNLLADGVDTRTSLTYIEPGHRWTDGVRHPNQPHALSL